MRKIRPEDEIPVLHLQEEEIKRRISKAENHVIPWNARQAMQEIDDMLKDGQRKNSIDFVKMLHDAADVYMDSIYEFAVCKTGCAHCCNDIPVELTLLEAGYIEEMTGHKINRKAKHRNKAANSAKGYCTFLNQEDAKCSIYEYRPLTCRLFASMDTPDLCKGRFTKHHYHALNSHAFWSKMFDVMASISNDFAGNKKKRLQPISEIRSYFKV